MSTLDEKKSEGAGDIHRSIQGIVSAHNDILEICRQATEVNASAEQREAANRMLTSYLQRQAKKKKE